MIEGVTEALWEEALPEFLVGQREDKAAMTGCTAIVAPSGAVCGVDVRGGSPATRDTDALNPTCNRKFVHAIFLTGGSLFGLGAADGLIQFLEERGIGRDVNVTVVPNVCSAALFDLKCGSASVRPDLRMGREAGENAFSGQPFRSGNFGAGTGATVGKRNGIANAMKGGIGRAVYQYKNLIAGAIFAVNCVGDVRENGQTLAGSRQGDGFADSERMILGAYESQQDMFSIAPGGDNTVIGCLVTNAALSKTQATRLAGQGHNAIARMVYPAHSIYDGDTVFALCSGKISAAPDAVSILAAHAAQAAILDAVKSAETFEHFLAWRDFYATRQRAAGRTLKRT